MGFFKIGSSELSAGLAVNLDPTALFATGAWLNMRF
jgi:hypothetical protein